MDKIKEEFDYQFYNKKCNGFKGNSYFLINHMLYYDNYSREGFRNTLFEYVFIDLKDMTINDVSYKS